MSDRVKIRTCALLSSTGASRSVFGHTCIYQTLQNLEFRINSLPFSEFHSLSQADRDLRSGFLFQAINKRGCTCFALQVAPIECWSSARQEMHHTVSTRRAAGERRRGLQGSCCVSFGIATSRRPAHPSISEGNFTRHKGEVGTELKLSNCSGDHRTWPDFLH